MDHHKLVKDALKLKPGAQQQLYEYYAPDMLGVCYRYTKSVNDAEDVLQDGFIKVFARLHQYKSEGELGAWIRRIMVNTALNYLKKNRKYQYELSFDNVLLHPVSSDDPVVKLDAKELAEYIDGISSWWVNLHGHAHPYIAKKIYKQATTLEHVIFTGFTHRPAVELAEKLMPLLPGNFSKIFYSDNGSTAVEVALKMALQFWKNIGHNERTRIIAFNDAYHGDTFGAMSASGRSIFTNAFSDKLFEVIFIDAPTTANIAQLKAAIEKYKNEVACLIYEPILQGAGGMKVYEAGPLNDLLSFVKGRGIICIADEVLTGFYRTGKMFASDAVDTKPDIICLSKGLTGGTMALGITACLQKVYDAFASEDRVKTFFPWSFLYSKSISIHGGVGQPRSVAKEKMHEQCSKDH